MTTSNRSNHGAFTNFQETHATAYRESVLLKAAQTCAAAQHSATLQDHEALQDATND